MPTKITPRSLAATAAAIAVATGGALAAASAIAGSSDSTGVEAPAASLVASGTDPVATAAATDRTPVAPAPAYAAVARSSQRPTERVTKMTAVLAQRFPDLQGRAFTGVKAPDGTQTWVVSGSRYTCFGADNSDGTGYTCAPNQQAAREPITLVEKRQKGDTSRTVALVPDTIPALRAAGRSVEARNNVVVVEHDSQATLEAIPANGGKPFAFATK